MTPSVVASYGIVLLFGFACGWVSSRAVARRAYAAGVADERNTDMGEGEQLERRGSTPSWIILVLVAALVAVGVGVGVVTTNRAADAAAAERTAAFAGQTACLNRWAADFTDTLNARVDASRLLDRAEQRRDRALDRVIEVSAALRRIPPESVEADLTRALENADAARRNLAEVRADTEQTRTDNPYPPPPTLTCPAPVGPAAEGD